MPLELRYDPDPILATVCATVLAVDEDLREFARQMIEAMRAESGAGLAAPQVGRSVRMFVMEDMQLGEDDRYHTGPPLTFINPVFTFKSPETELVSEGCLSFPERPKKMLRHKAVTIRAINLQGEAVTYQAKDFAAQCVQHEMDHLDGKTLYPIVT